MFVAHLDDDLAGIAGRQLIASDFGCGLCGVVFGCV
jgi:hypothetical protein